jgi:uncharacterized protein
MMTTEKKKYPARGFASMDLKRRREVASAGGKALAPEQRSFSQNRELAAQAGRKGGSNVADKDRAFSRNRELAVEAGRKGGRASHGGKTKEQRLAMDLA